VVDFLEQQRSLCSAHNNCAFVRVVGEDKVGLAIATLGKEPINGLKHPVTRNATGWYIWCGEAFSTAPDFFEPMCVDHLLEQLPGVATFLALPPGYKFLTTESYSDIWFDESLIKI
jgi:hypothetical protein